MEVILGFAWLAVGAVMGHLAWRLRAAIGVLEKNNRGLTKLLADMQQAEPDPPDLIGSVALTEEAVKRGWCEVTVSGRTIRLAIPERVRQQFWEAAARKAASEKVN